MLVLEDGNAFNDDEITDVRKAATGDGDNDVKSSGTSNNNDGDSSSTAANGDDTDMNGNTSNGSGNGDGFDDGRGTDNSDDWQMNGHTNTNADGSDGDQGDIDNNANTDNTETDGSGSGSGSIGTNNGSGSDSDLHVSSSYSPRCQLDDATGLFGSDSDPESASGLAKSTIVRYQYEVEFDLSKVERLMKALPKMEAALGEALVPAMFQECAEEEANASNGKLDGGWVKPPPGVEVSDERERGRNNEDNEDGQRGLRMTTNAMKIIRRAKEVSVYLYVYI